ncbi:MAG: hypothetical protein WA081_04765 [Desulfosalsimonadaceae bacterium]
MDKKMKPCPFCGEDILAVALKCKHCQTMLDGSAQQQKVSVVGRDPFAEYHTEIQGKKKGKLTFIGWCGIGLGFLGCELLVGEEIGLTQSGCRGFFYDSIKVTFLIPAPNSASKRL